MLPSLFTFDFDLIFGSFKTFWGRNELFFGSTDVVEEHLFSIVPLILTFDFDLILGSFLTLWGYLWGRGRVQKL